MIYVGTAAELLGIEMKEVEVTIGKWFKEKKKAIDLNIKAVHLGARYARENLEKLDPYRIERMDGTSGQIIIDGNSAAALGCVFGGFTVATWYPITPSSSLCETVAHYANRFRIDKDTGKANFAIVQAEDELAAAGMAVGAGWAGARAMTATSGPGISLMSEFVGLAYFAEVPCVIFDIQRMGPSTGLPTRTSQGDISQLYQNSHGDTKHVVLFPGNMKECFEFAQLSFDLAERLQQPIFVASDLDLGMNNWMTEPFDYPTKPYDRGKVLSAEDLERVGEFGRYRDVDGDGIPFRTLPGTEHPLAAYLTRGSGHNQDAVYSEKPDDYTANLDRLLVKYETAKKYVPGPVIEQVKDASVGLIAYGSTDAAMEECREQLRSEYGIKSSYLRMRALPMTSEVREFVKEHESVFVIEQNRDGQLADIIRLEVGRQQDKIRKILNYDGLSVSARFVTEHVVSKAESAERDE
jgi:2-oxoglutarate ferredoxin oxidoreductase subunit alpha